jgi:Tol biopolymer transport system component
MSPYLRMPTFRRLDVIAAVAVLVYGCGAAPNVGAGAATVTPSSAAGASPSPGAAASSASPRASTPTAAASPTAAATPTASAVPVAGEAWIAFQSLADEFGPEPVDDDEGDDTIYLVRPDGTGLHRLVPGVFRGSEIRPTWSPDGTRLAFIRARLPQDRGELWVINADGSGAELLYTCVGPNVPNSDCNSMDYPDWAANGDSIFFEHNSHPTPQGPPGTFEIWRYDLATGQVGHVLRHDDGPSIEHVRVSPDGKQVVYVQSRNLTAESPDSALFVADLTTGDERRITDWGMFPAYPDWSLDDRIAFNTYDLRWFPTITEAANLYSVAVDGTGLRRLTDYGPNDTRATQPRWTSDGGGLIYTLVTRVTSDPYGERRIWSMDADGGNARVLAEGVIGTHPELRPRS